MPDLLLELFSEEIPARMQRKAADDLRRLVTDALVERGLVYEGAKAFATPRRLALHVAGLPVRGRDVREERKGPRVGAPEAAVQGFLKAAGLASLDQATIVSDAKKGDSYLAVIEKPGQETVAAIAEIVPAIIRAFPWPKSMRWGKASAAGASLRWVRPLHSILCTFGAETEEPEIVPFEVDGIVSGNVTFGHRFHAPSAITVRRFDDYVSSLEKARVVLDADRRKEIILADARTLAFAQGLDLVEDDGLLEEVAGLVEWPVVLMGSFEERFLDIPGEAIRATIRANQKCFVLRQPLPSPLGGEGGIASAMTDEGTSDLSFPHPSASQTPSPPKGEGNLANKFILVSNLIASDGGKAIVAGNERVVRARLSDAVYFFATDKSDLPDLETLSASADKLGLDLGKPLDQRMAKLDRLGVVFHAKLGTQGERVQRIAALAQSWIQLIGGDYGEVERAAKLAKADLVSEMVGEFPELQGRMGRLYAELQDEPQAVCIAIEEHYKPIGPTDSIPTEVTGKLVALADKLNTIVGMWIAGEKPTGSKDPYAVRRAALGVVRILESIDQNFNIYAVIKDIYDSYSNDKSGNEFEDIVEFIIERFKVKLKSDGFRDDVIDAARGALPHPLYDEGMKQMQWLAINDVGPIKRRVLALSSPENQARINEIAQAHKRAKSIIRSVMGAEYKLSYEESTFDMSEWALFSELDNILSIGVAPNVSAALISSNFNMAIIFLYQSVSKLNKFIDGTMINNENIRVRDEFIKVLSRFILINSTVVDFERLVVNE